MKRQRLGLLLAAGCGVLGCHHCCYQPEAPPPPPAAVCGPCSPSGSLVPAPGPLPAAPPGLPAVTPAPQFSPGLPAVTPAPQFPSGPASVPPGSRGYEPPLASPEPPPWQPPAGGGVRLATPEPMPPQPSPEATAPQAPPAPPRPAVTEEAPPAPPRPAVTEEPRPSPSLPVGIPQFATVREGVASGLTPLAEGLDWLKANGYRTVLYLRRPGEEDAAQRRRAEERGLSFRSLEISPQTLSRAVVDEFNRLVGDPALRPLFVFDRDGVLAGGLWYLYFRTAERLSDAEARLRAARLGLREDQSGERRLMWLAIQKYLSEQSH